MNPSTSGIPALPAKLTDLPECLEASPELQALHQVLVARFRAEAAEANLNTVGEIILERLATYYCIVRHKEATDGFDHNRDQRDWNTFWLGLAKEFQSHLRAGALPDDDLLAKKFVGIIEAALAGLHEDVAGPMRERFVAALAGAGM